MSHNGISHIQEQNTAKLVMSTFYKLAKRDGITPGEITRYLRQKFGDVWRTNVLTSKAEETLEQSAALGFLERRGDKYTEHLAREAGCRRRRRRRCRRRRKCGCRRRRRRRRRRCGCCS